jgi:hypothetical protein
MLLVMEHAAINNLKKPHTNTHTNTYTHKHTHTHQHTDPHTLTHTHAPTLKKHKGNSIRRRFDYSS